MSQKIMNKIFSLDTQKYLTNVKFENISDGKKIIFEIKDQLFLFVLWIPNDIEIKRKLSIFHKDNTTGYTLKNAQVFERKDVRDFENLVRCFIE